MLNNVNISSPNQKLIIYVVLAIVTLAVYWQVNQFDFINLDDQVYVTQNDLIRSGISPEGIRWALGTKYFGLWNPLVWLSFMADYQLFGLNAGGYHLINLLLHILSTLLLFWLFCRMTQDIWKSAFVAALFALHPLHVESVAWIAERKDVLSGFFWMLTLCFYVYYTERPVIKRYILVVFSFFLAIMSKPMVVTLPVIMILLDYWPLKRFESKMNNLFLWQLKEKALFFILSAVFAVITLYAPHDTSSQLFPLASRIANAPVAFITYLVKTFRPYNLAILYPFSAQPPLWQVLGASLLILIITIYVIVMVKRLPYLFVGWFWYAIAIAPVIGIIQIGIYLITDRYHYIPSIGIAVMLAWGIPSLIKNEEIRKRILFPAGIAFITIMAFLTWKQCGYWKNSVTLFSNTLCVTKDNALAHNNLASALAKEGKIKEAVYHYQQSIIIGQDSLPYNNIGIIYAKLGQDQKAIDYYNKAIRLKPDYAMAYFNRGLIQEKQNRYQLALNDYNQAIHFHPFPRAYHNRGIIYAKLGQHKLAIEDFNNAILMDSNNPLFYLNRASAYLNEGNNKFGCFDAQKACVLGNCKLLEMSKVKGDCP